MMKRLFLKADIYINLRCVQLFIILFLSSRIHIELDLSVVCINKGSNHHNGTKKWKTYCQFETSGSPDFHFVVKPRRWSHDDYYMV